jgi:hypothetical protein
MSQKVFEVFCFLSLRVECERCVLFKKAAHQKLVNEKQKAPFPPALSSSNTEKKGCDVSIFLSFTMLTKLFPFILPLTPISISSPLNNNNDLTLKRKKEEKSFTRFHAKNITHILFFSISDLKEGKCV